MESSGRIANWLSENCFLWRVVCYEKLDLIFVKMSQEVQAMVQTVWKTHSRPISELLTVGANPALSMFCSHSAASHLGLLSKHPVKGLKDNLDLSESWWYFPYIQCPGTRGEKKKVMSTYGALRCDLLIYHGMYHDA